MVKLVVPENFVVPAVLKTDKIFARCLTVNDVVKDYDAVITSINHLRKTKPFGPGSDWPGSDLTLEQDLIDLGWHQKEFQNRTSFAYTVMSLDEKLCLGCLYIYPSDRSGFDCKIIMWVRESEVDKGLDVHLFEAVKKWINEFWPFRNPGYPGREIDWKEWDKH